MEAFPKTGLVELSYESNWQASETRSIRLLAMLREQDKYPSYKHK